MADDVKRALGPGARCCGNDCGLCAKEAERDVVEVVEVVEVTEPVSLKKADK